MPLVVDRAGDEAGFSEEDGRELEEPAGFAGEAVNDGDDADGGSWREWGPPLGEELEAARVGDEGGGVRDGMLRVEFVGGEGAKRVAFVGVGDWMETHLVVVVFERSVVVLCGVWFGLVYIVRGLNDVFSNAGLLW